MFRSQRSQGCDGSNPFLGTKTPNEKLGVFAFSGIASLLANADRLSVQSGDKFDLEAFDSKDPDGDNLSYLWMYYPEAGTYQGKINMGAENVHGVYLRAPEVIKTKTMHFILKLSDKGEPSLTRYKRIIVTVLPK